MHILISLLLTLSLAVSCFGQNIIICKKKAGCSAATDEVGYVTLGGSTYDFQSTYGYCILETPECSGTLGYAYAAHSGTDTETVKVGVFLDDGGNDCADAADALVSSSQWVEISASTSDAGETSRNWAKSSAKVGGTVSKANKYCVCILPNTSTYYGYYDSGTTWALGSLTYATPPSDLTGFSNLGMNRRISVIVEIE